MGHDWLTVRELTTWNASRKATCVSTIAPDAVVLAADTLVTIDGEVLGKPADFDYFVYRERSYHADPFAGEDPASA